ncbi:hypothetical protein KG088_17365, partial [Halomonas sp. TRM85114]|uniref:NACHT domain-containing protein n=1 Tax=Halomonas jincaotanensis TaxID=2810616 RepID=UPI001BD30C16
MRFYQPLTLGVERRRVSHSAEDEPAGAGPRSSASRSWDEGLSSPSIEYEEHPAAEVLNTLQRAPPSHRFWLIRGEPGAGKSTLLAQWFSTWVPANPAVRFGMTVPVLFRLSELDQDDLKLDPDGLADRLWRRGATLAQAWLGQDAAALYRLAWVRHFQPIWLLDGLDEVSPDLLNERLYEALAALPGLKFVSCRTAVYAALRQDADAYKESPRDYLILSLKPTEQRSFLEQALEGNSELAGVLHDRLQASPQLRLLSGNPLMLTLIVELAEPDRLELPTTRAAFYRGAITRLWERKKPPGHDIRYLSDLRDRVLTELAEAMGLEDLEWDSTELTALCRSIAGDDCSLLLDALERTNLLVIDRHRETVRFFHFTFQEYYLARALQSQGLRIALQRHWADARYDEALALLSAVLFEQGQVDNIVQGIQWLIDQRRAHRKRPTVLWQRGRSPLRTALHLLTRSGIPLSRLPEAENALLSAVERSRLCCKALAADPGTPLDLLSRLAADSEWHVSWEVAANPNTPPEVLTHLSTDPGPYVRPKVAANPNAPPELLAHLATDLEPCVRQSVAENPNAPSELLEHLASDLEPCVRQSVAENPNAPSELLEHLA